MNDHIKDDAIGAHHHWLRGIVLPEEFYAIKRQRLERVIEQDQDFNLIFHEQARIIDLGCGSPWYNMSTFAQLFKERGIDEYVMEGVDLEHKKNETMLINSNFHVITSDMFEYLRDKTVGRDGSIDLVILNSADDTMIRSELGKSTSVLTERKELFFDTARRILRPGGYLWFDGHNDKFNEYFDAYGFQDKLNLGFYKLSKE